MRPQEVLPSLDCFTGKALDIAKLVALVINNVTGHNDLR